ncbi:ABC transporter ATP-binding protein [Tissierella creatinophila]|uniref:Xylose import ATP-binding protein XylG n=1 Tax=Tissierella creatinophila DSM 6911 TaxID=1123403 RepID=A0A1U7M5U6_TISCR|nr:ABC transporter ATP-binding protein [Tissierella creatinophila]OLS02661.1 xylose import ATP-binding protein XylG [Tissierella creatinophila DSM 6911]
MNDYIVEMTNITKSFGDVKAVVDGQFNLKKGEIHSLIGENGAGKSTMMKMLYGIYPNDSGTIKIKGKEVQGLTPNIAIKDGIGMVHQEFMLVNELTVLENIILGFEPTKNITIDFDKAKKEIQKYIDTYNMDIQPGKKINQIPLGEAQRVEIIKTLYRGAEIVILDEPTAVLTPQETVKFFEILNSMKADGKSIVFISHKLKEVMEISDRITVMRDGQYMNTVNKEDTDIDELAKLMVGREVFLNVKKKDVVVGETVLKIDNLWTSGEKELSKIKGISLDVKQGEILGIAGIDGNGQSELIEAITGLRKVEKGKVILDGEDITNKSPLKIRKSGMTHIPEDRNIRGLNRKLSIKDNMIAVKIDKKPYSKGLVLNNKEIDSFTKDLIERFDVRPTNPEILTEALSGGNAQKIVVAREVDADGKLLIASQPTRGVDIGAIESIRKILNEVKANGKGIILVSADLDEILSLSDRIAVMYEGKITGILDAKNGNENNIGLLMMGGKLGHNDSEDIGGNL